MGNLKPQYYYLMVLLTGAILVAFFIFRPFFYSIIIAMVFAVVFNPVHQKVLGYTRRRRGVAAVITTVIIVISILVPVTLLGTQIFNEAQLLYASITEGGGKDNILNAVGKLINYVQRFVPAQMKISADFDQYLKQALDWLIQHLGDIFSNFAKIILNFFIFFAALYYMLKDGPRLKKTVVELSPLADTDDEKIFNTIESAINSVIKGNLTVAAVQGALTAAGFSVFGVPNAVLWGSVTAIAALIPGVGTSLVFIPAILFLFISGRFLPGIGLLLWGAGAVGLVDNFLGPKLVGRGMRMHPFIILLSVLGGIGFFGPVGFLLGPLTISLFFAFFEIYSSIKPQGKKDETA
ncbi:MAG: AI-2E family transporter [Desulfobacteraceae bacterium]|nr:MAG: AI-2E family transporter [Desulfobacteraceae bacterium]